MRKAISAAWMRRLQLRVVALLLHVAAVQLRQQVQFAALLLAGQALLRRFWISLSGSFSSLLMYVP